MLIDFFFFFYYIGRDVKYNFIICILFFSVNDVKILDYVKNFLFYRKTYFIYIYFLVYKYRL